MNIELQEFLAERADAVEPPVFDPRAVMGHGERLVRRRTRLVMAGSAVVLALVVGVTALVGERGRERPEPAPAPWPAPGTRPLTYGQDQTLHLGDRVIDTELDFLSIDVTDEGAALTTLDGGIWFTDGSEIDRIGTTLGPLSVRPRSVSWDANGRPAEWVVGDVSGSLVAWLEYSAQGPSRPRLRVFDSSVPGVVDRVPIPIEERNEAMVHTLTGGAVFVEETTRGGVSVTMHRYDVDTGVLERAEPAEVLDARRAGPRVLVVGSSAAFGDLLAWDRGFAPPGYAESVTVLDDRLDGVFDPQTGNPVIIAAPPGVPDGERLWFAQWLDDDRFVVIGNDPSDPLAGPTGDLVVCRISAGRCGSAVDDTTWSQEPLIPGFGAVGGEIALGRAMQADIGAREEE